ncbi:MAG: neutral zinc metallopeptidase [Sphingomonadales bacterium]
MKWRGGRRSSNIDDRRAQSGSSRGAFGSGRSGLRFPMPSSGGGKMSGLTLIIIIVGALIFGVDPMALLGGLTGTGGLTSAPSTSTQPLTQADRDKSDFVAVVLADTEDTWTEIFRNEFGQDYPEPKLVLFRGAVRSACGQASSAVGPFYCPGDRQVYIDLSFFDELSQRFGAPGDFAQAYVIAHEVGHHVQTVLGISKQVRAAQSRVSKAESKALNVKMELQADCYAGLWAYNIKRSQNVSLEPGDIDEALRAANAIGDDTLQRQATGRVVPDSFTHGTSAQRRRWFRMGYERGEFKACDTFSAGQL